MSDEIDPPAFAVAMWREAQALRAARLAVEAAQKEFDLQRDVTHESVRRYGAALSVAEQAVERETIRTLYWEHRDITVSAIAESFALEGGASNVYRHVGKEPYDLECPGGCGSTVQLPARTSKLAACDDCRERIAVDRKRRWEAHKSLLDERTLAWESRIRAELVAGRTAEEIYAEYAERFETNGPMPRIRELAAQQTIE